MTEDKLPKRLIEVDLPIKRISAHARREKSIRHGHISTLHIWWARRPLAACRAVILASLWPDPADKNCPERFRKEAAERMRAFRDKVGGKPRKWSDPQQVREALLDFIADFANWDNSNDPSYLETCRVLVQAAHEALGGARGTRPLVVDPFAGGGAIPLEALRVGADAFASDLNPVALLLNKVVLEYIPKYGQQLADDVRKSGAWVKKEAEKELADVYPADADGRVPAAYLWSRTIVSEDPGIRDQPVEVPLIRSMWLANRGGRGIALRWQRGPAGQIITDRIATTSADGEVRKIQRPRLEIVSVGDRGKVESGTTKGGAATCPITGFTTPVERVRAQLKARHGGTTDARLLAVVTVGHDGRQYRAPTPRDTEVMAAVSSELARVKAALKANTLAEGQINHLRGFFNIVLYGIEDWQQMFSPRQTLALATLSRLSREAGARASSEHGRDYAEALQACLAMAVGRQADYTSAICTWRTAGEFIGHTFAQGQALPMKFDIAEVNPFSDSSGNWAGAIDWVARVCENIAAAKNVPGQTHLGSATRSPLADASVNAVITDPPYYAAVPYADLSDFFYPWLRCTLREQLPGLFSEPLTPKAEECVSLAHRAAMYRNKDNAWFESTMKLASSEARRVTADGGIGLWVFANKETEAWEAMLGALIHSGWTVAASWPIDTEMGNRLRARNSAALGSSIHILCRPRSSEDSAGDWRDVLAELPRRVAEWLPRLAAEGIVGADAIFACLGPALEIFSRYARVEKASGEVVPLHDYLEHVWAAVAKEALAMIFAGADATGFEEDARLTAMWLWTLSAGAASGGDASDDDEADEPADEDEGAAKKTKTSGFSLEYDAARKIAQGLGAHLEDLGSLVEVKGETARLLAVSERTRALFGKPERQATGTKAGKKKSRAKQLGLGFDEELAAAEADGAFGETGTPEAGGTVLDRVHQAMILFGSGRGEALKRFLVEGGAGRDERFWRLAQALAALYPTGTEERRWVEGIMARKKGLGL